jgi:transcriptional regulator with XRE-family HTH domain
MDQEQRLQEAASLQAAMDRLGWSAATLAAESGVSKNTISRALRGENTQPGTLRKLRDTLGVKPQVVVREESGGYDADAEVIGLAFKVWISDMEPEERPAALAAIFEAIASYRNTGR